jgi:hypothetical protein
MGCGAGAISDGGWIFDQCIGTVPTEHHKEFE